MNVKETAIKYHKSIFASAAIATGTLPAISDIYTESSALLGSVGLDWGSIFALASGNIYGVIPYVGLATVVYLKNLGKTEEEKTKEELLELIEEYNSREK